MNRYPALNGEVVTEAHARICREQGHAIHSVNDVDTGTCPRCGEVTRGGAVMSEHVFECHCGETLPAAEVEALREEVRRLNAEIKALAALLATAQPVGAQSCRCQP